MLNSIRTPGIGGLPGDTSWQTFMDQYVNNWSAVQQALAQMGTGADLLGTLGSPAIIAPPGEGDTTIIKKGGGGGGGGRRRDTGFTGGGYAQPNQVNNSMGGWGSVLNALGGAAGGDADRAARRAARRGGDDGVYVKEPKERTRERSRTHTSKDGTTTTSTNINVSRNGGTAISNQSGGDGNRKRKKKNSEMVY